MEPIPDKVRQFLYAHVNSVDELEILRIVAVQPNVEFSASALADELHLPAEDIEVAVRSLEGNKLLKISSQEPMSCVYRPPSDAIDAQVQELVKTYIERPVSLIKMVYDRQKQLRLFSDAFRLKKPEE